MFVKNEFINENSIEERKYQINIANSSIKKSTLIVLPTGLGKTIIALLIIADQLKNKDNKILFLSPTKPLVNQHTQFLKTHLISKFQDEIVVFTGEISPNKRKDMWEKSRIIISTPQVIENDLISKRINLSEISLIIYDEVHRTVGNYSYVFISDMYRKQKKNRYSIGMTASPGNDLIKILEICKTLEIENIEIRTKFDNDVRPYVHNLKIEWKEISLPKEFSHTIQLLRKSLSIRLKKLKELGVLESSSVSNINRTKLLSIQKRIQEGIRSSDSPPKELYKAASAQNASLKLYHAIELIQTQNVNSFLNYFQRMSQESLSKSASIAAKDIMKDQNILEAIAYARTLKIEHPKIPAVIKIITEQLKNNPKSKIIIFTHYRDTASHLLKNLESISIVKAVRFIGQAGKDGDKGLTQKEQVKIIQDFKGNRYNVLIATSVAEEGLDIPSTDLVVFYEPVPSEIRTIQRRGRTARKMSGKVIILIAKGTPDEGYYWSARRKERAMKSELEILRSSLKKSYEDANTFYGKLLKEDNQKKIEEYSDETKIKIIVDNRESRSTIMRYLSNQNISIENQQLDVGDYVLSSRIGVERKNVDDFLSSLLEGKLFMQLRRLRSAYSRPILIIEGEELLTKRNISHNAIFGCFVSIIVDFGIPIITTKSPHETADFLKAIAKREQRDENKTVSIRGGKWSMSPIEQQQFIIEGLPNISSVLAQRLLQHFGSVRAIANASEEELCNVYGIGKNIASEIVKIFNLEYISN